MPATAAPPAFDAVAFAGGGNRCYWQGGFYEAVAPKLAAPPKLIVGVSAGAFQAAMALTGTGDKARGLVREACKAGSKTFDFAAWPREGTPFRVATLYRELLQELFRPEQMEALRQAPELLIQVSCPPRFIPAAVTALGSIAAYEIEKRFNGARYSQAGRWLGLSPAWVSTHDMHRPEELISAMLATAAVPPFMPVGRVNGRPALDGGFVDNPPLIKLREIEAAGGKTLVMTTRTGNPMTPVSGRAVARPSQPLTLSRFSIKQGAEMIAAYELGKRDGENYLRQLDKP